MTFFKRLSYRVVTYRKCEKQFGGHKATVKFAIYESGVAVTFARAKILVINGLFKHSLRYTEAKLEMKYICYISCPELKDLWLLLAFVKGSSAPLMRHVREPAHCGRD